MPDTFISVNKELLLLLLDDLKAARNPVVTFSRDPEVMRERAASETDGNLDVAIGRIERLLGMPHEHALKEQP